MSSLKTRSLALFLTGFLIFGGSAFGLTPSKTQKRARHRAAASTETTTAHVVKASYSVPPSHLSRLPKKKLVFSPWNVPTFADSTAGDSVDGEDLMVRRAAV